MQYVLIIHPWMSLILKKIRHVLSLCSISPHQLVRIKAYQELALLFPAGTLGVGVPVGLSHHLDEVPLCRVRLRPGLQRPHHLLPLPPLSVLLDQTTLGDALWLVQHHWWKQWERRTIAEVTTEASRTWFRKLLYHLGGGIILIVSIALWRT